jgi:hypothetical protein
LFEWFQRSRNAHSIHEPRPPTGAKGEESIWNFVIGAFLGFGVWDLELPVAATNFETASNYSFTNHQSPITNYQLPLTYYSSLISLLSITIRHPRVLPDSPTVESPLLWHEVRCLLNDWC